jgi:hypothetical protein
MKVLMPKPSLFRGGADFAALMAGSLALSACSDPRDITSPSASPAATASLPIVANYDGRWQGPLEFLDCHGMVFRASAEF